MNKEVLYKFVSQLADKLTNKEINDITDYLISFKKDNIKIKIVNKSRNPIPEYATSLSAGIDLRASLKESISVDAFNSRLIPTGLYIELPEGYEAQVRPRSGLALKYQITVLNSPGTIDADYRGEIGVILMNHSDTPFIIEPGDRIAQLVFNKIEQAEFIEVEELSKTERGKGGFGHTGNK